MELKQFLFDMPLKERQAFAASVGTTSSHLRNVAYGTRTLDEKVCVAIERQSKKIVTRQDLRPDDWHLIWPELAEQVPA